MCSCCRYMETQIAVAKKDEANCMQVWHSSAVCVAAVLRQYDHVSQMALLRQGIASVNACWRHKLHALGHSPAASFAAVLSGTMTSSIPLANVLLCANSMPARSCSSVHAWPAPGPC